MKQRRFLPLLAGLVLAGAVLLLAACGGPIVGSGDLVTEEYDLTDFTRIEVSHAFEVEVRRGDQHSVSITVDDNLLDRLRVEQDGDTLRIGFERGLDFGTATRRATIVLPEMRALSLSGASDANLSGFASDDPLDLRLSGASSIALDQVTSGAIDLEASGASRVTGRLRAADVRFEASGASRIELEGSGEEAELEASGASRLRLDDFTLRAATVRLSGASNAGVNVSRTLSAELSGASTLEYSGDPSIRDVETSGASQIRRRGE